MWRGVIVINGENLLVNTITVTQDHVRKVSEDDQDITEDNHNWTKSAAADVGGQRDHIHLESYLDDDSPTELKISHISH